jgi:1,6-anhydro-N-acetylmuramate kinase
MSETPHQKREDYLAAGVMSGTSVDGLDMALCRFSVSSGRWKYDIIKTAARCLMRIAGGPAGLKGQWNSGDLI